MLNRYATLVVSLTLQLGLAGQFFAAEPAVPEQVVLVTIDTLRADHLGMYGYPFGTSPFLDSLSNRGVVFEDAHTSIHITLPAHLSIFSGVYPFVHGVQDNYQEYNGSLQMMAEYFQSRGYKTAGLPVSGTSGAK